MCVDWFFGGGFFFVVWGEFGGLCCRCNLLSETTKGGLGGWLGVHLFEVKKIRLGGKKNLKDSTTSLKTPIYGKNRAIGSKTSHRPASSLFRWLGPGEAGVSSDKEGPTCVENFGRKNRGGDAHILVLGSVGKGAQKLHKQEGCGDWLVGHEVAATLDRKR